MANGLKTQWYFKMGMLDIIKKVFNPIPSGLVPYANPIWTYPYPSPTVKQIAVSQDTLFQIPAVFSAIRLISETIGSMSLKLYKIDERNNNRIRVRSHPLLDVIDRPNLFQTQSEFLEAIAIGMMQGQSYSVIERSNGKIIGFVPFSMSDVNLLIYNNTPSTKYYYTVNTKLGIKNIDYNDMLAIPGFGQAFNSQGLDIAKLHGNTLALFLAVNEYANGYFNRGARPLGYLKTDGVLNEQSKKDYAEGFSNLVSDSINSGRLPLLENGIEFVSMSNTGRDSNVDATQSWAVKEVARIFRIPPYLLGDTSGLTYNNVEQQNTNFLQFTLKPYLVRIENRLNLLLSDSERANHYFEFDTNSLVRADAKTRAELYASLKNSGVVTANEIRNWENLPPLDGGDELLAPLNMIPADQLGKPTN